MAKIYWGKTALTGGAANALDSLDGNNLNDGDIAHVIVSGVLHVYKLDADSGLTESSPERIVPDANAGTKVWIRSQVYTTVEGSFKMGTFEITASGDTAITGVGFTPSFVELHCVLESGTPGAESQGWDDGTNHYCTYINGTSTRGSSATRSINIVEGGGSEKLGSISSMDADGFTITMGIFLGDVHIVGSYVAYR
jgi:hypothetical protein